MENDIDIVLMGHDHVYARSYIMGGETGMVAEVSRDEQGNALSEISNPDGVQYVTFNSASGSKYYGITNELFEYTAVQSQEKTPNYSYAFVDEDSFTITTYRSSDNTVVDTVTIKKESKATGSENNGATNNTGSVEVDITLPGGESGNWITTDTNADISVSGSETNVPDGAKFTCTTLLSGAEYERAAAAVKASRGNANFVAFDMNLTTASGVFISRFDGKVNVSMPIPAGLSAENGKTIVVYYLEDNGSLTRCETAVKYGFVTFATNHFSTYIYVEESATSPKTGDEMLSFYVGILAAAALGGLFYYGHKKKFFG